MAAILTFATVWPIQFSERLDVLCQFPFEKKGKSSFDGSLARTIKIEMAVR
ncbi:hypothetical protein LJC71_04160 [Desulfosarcina sp. OttesenSCG-928-A07]|nr:hypothetical protein [Desulfosarcina sp. OttesenSCG-928-G17]MDL2328933.1 hypothetical protein [Desulfosarcina sp. OttesenSCG-928-A07]